MPNNHCRLLGGSGMSVVAFTEPDTGQVNPLQDKLQVMPGDNAILALPGWLGQLERPFFQTLVENAKPIPFEMNQLHLVALPVEKNKDLAGHRVLPQLRPDQSTQAVEALPHIGGSPMQIIRMGSR